MIKPELIKWVATGIIIIAAILISISNTFAVLFWPYLLFFIGHIVWSISALALKDNSLFWVNAGLLPVDIYAIYIRI